MTKFKNDGNYKRYRIQGKTYYKVGDEPTGDPDIVSEIWLLKNVSNEDFKLLIRRYKKSSVYSLYNGKGTCIYRTYSISEVK